jgi:hypothetical protein
MCRQTDRWKCAQSLTALIVRSLCNALHAVCEMAFMSSCVLIQNIFLSSELSTEYQILPRVEQALSSLEIH